MKKIIFTLLVGLAFGFTSKLETEEINWLSFEEAIELNKTNPKSILINVYTDWCGWCKKMDKDTYSNAKIIKYITKNFYAVKLNAEQKEGIVFNGKTFKFINKGRRGYHEFAAAILNGKMSYPSTIILNKEVRITQRIPGYINADKMEKILVYLHTESYKNTEWPTFEKNYKSEL